MIYCLYSTIWYQKERSTLAQVILTSHQGYMFTGEIILSDQEKKQWSGVRRLVRIYHRSIRVHSAIDNTAYVGCLYIFEEVPFNSLYLGTGQILRVFSVLNKPGSVIRFHASIRGSRVSKTMLVLDLSIPIQA